ncbi:hypothetical protein BGZ68_004880 [Mortierella alpina]|nr:hypothetical protein BGZ68_004880 [Mortierella alpina]
MKPLGYQESIIRSMIQQYHWLFDLTDEEEGDAVADETIAAGEADAEDGDVYEDEEGWGEFPEVGASSTSSSSAAVAHRKDMDSKQGKKAARLNAETIVFG